MRRTWGFLAVGLLFSVTACTVTITVPARSPEPAPYETTLPSTPLPASPAVVLDACPFLAVDELAWITGLSTEIRPLEQEAHVDGPQEDRYGCLYENSAQSSALAPHLQIVVPPKGGATVIAVVDDTAKAGCREPITAIAGVGDKAVYCESAKDPAKVIVTVGKLSHGEARLAVLDIVKIRPDAYETVAKLLAERL
ncbi:hypothetical protein [Amycolatopsis pittospori]|uniref:hypothetical protein n=1 Tax=Amycolatopsis pittospori TaxID=2749434 RepID=UPI0015F0A595|nr:hypothetical protein [Amycolatopsis pittospori]